MELLNYDFANPIPLIWFTTWVSSLLNTLYNVFASSTTTPTIAKEETGHSFLSNMSDWRSVHGKRATQVRWQKEINFGGKEDEVDDDDEEVIQEPQQSVETSEPVVSNGEELDEEDLKRIVGKGSLGEGIGKEGEV